MGRHGRGRIERALIGSVTARVIGYTQRDVLVVPKGAAIGWNTIMLATDGSKYSASATDRAISFAQSYGGKLKVLSVVNIPTEFYAEAPAVVEDLVRQAKGFVAEVQARAAAAGVPAETYVSESEASQAIINMAKEQKADIIVMGSHGRTGLRRLLMGSVTEEVLGHASCPVLVVKS